MLIPGLKIGHATNEEFHTGCTVFLCPEGSVGSVDIRGPAPGSRESALLAPDKSVQTLNAIVLTGGSAFGLASADGVMRFLAEQGIGHPTPIKAIPIVPAAVVYDLFLGGGKFLPDAAMGYEACQNASDTAVPQGNVGAGAGVTVGKWGGFRGMMKSGFGLASWQEDDLIVMAAAVVNAVGDVVNGDGSVLAGARGEDVTWLADVDPLRRFPTRPPIPVGTNTTLVVVATNAQMSKVEAYRLAQRAHDGLAIAIHPVHTTHDGDTAFALASNQVEANFDLVANTAVVMTAEAIRNAVREAASIGPIPGLKQE
jgi:L-aminopeptidase/D-esterase-like protein